MCAFGIEHAGSVVNSRGFNLVDTRYNLEGNGYRYTLLFDRKVVIVIIFVGRESLAVFRHGAYGITFGSRNNGTQLSTVCNLSKVGHFAPRVVTLVESLDFNRALVGRNIYRHSTILCGSTLFGNLDYIVAVVQLGSRRSAGISVKGSTFGRFTDDETDNHHLTYRKIGRDGNGEGCRLVGGRSRSTRLRVVIYIGIEFARTRNAAVPATFVSTENLVGSTRCYIASQQKYRQATPSIGISNLQIESGTGIGQDRIVAIVPSLISIRSGGSESQRRFGQQAYTVQHFAFSLGPLVTGSTGCGLAKVVVAGLYNRFRFYNRIVFLQLKRSESVVAPTRNGDIGGKPHVVVGTLVGRKHIGIIGITVC